MRGLTVRYRIIGAFFALAGALMTFMLLFAPARVEREHEQRLRGVGTAVLVVLASPVLDAARDPKALALALEHVLRVEDVAFVEVLGADGATLGQAGTRPPVVAKLPSRGHAFQRDDGYLVMQDESARAPGVVTRIAISRAGLERELASFYTTMVLIGGIVVLLSALAALILSRLVIRPIEQITRGVRALEKGDIERVDVSAPESDELHELGEAINRMRSELSKSYREHARAARRARRRADELERANVELDRFAYAASHDLRAPLRGLAALAEFIGEDLQDVSGVSAEVVENLALMRRRVRRMDALLLSLLDYSRVGRRGQDTEDVDVHALVEGVIDLLSVPDGFEVVIERRLPTLETARAPLERIFMHLIGNAIKHHDRARGRVEVGFEETLTFAVFTVSDDGPGIPADFQEKAFKIFGTLKRRDEVEGSGMGLALIKKSAESVGGELTLESEGRGCRFIVRWPLEWDNDETISGDLVSLVRGGGV